MPVSEKARLASRLRPGHVATIFEPHDADRRRPGRGAVRAVSYNLVAALLSVEPWFFGFGRSLGSSSAKEKVQGWSEQVRPQCAASETLYGTRAPPLAGQTPSRKRPLALRVVTRASDERSRNGCSDATHLDPHRASGRRDEVRRAA